jgi:outer membrane protein assembly factor BamB
MSRGIVKVRTICGWERVLVDGIAAHPALYAIGAATLAQLWHSTSAQLHVGGKYNTPLIAHGVVFAGTDRVQALGLH